MLLAPNVYQTGALAQPLWWLALAMLVALAVDRLWGEPPVRLHPVVWMGNYLQWAGTRLQRRAVQHTGVRDWPAFAWGALLWCLGACMVAALAFALQYGLQTSWTAGGGPAFIVSALVCIACGVLLKPLLAWAMLRSEVMAVEAALSAPQGGSLEAGRTRLQWLVSRDVSALSAHGVRESAIESLAENLNDSVVAPLFWFVCFGLPGAAVYRFANTADAMWGYKGVYRGQNWEWAGKWAARVDDVLNWIPARMTAGLLMLACARRSWRQLPLEAARTPSPNSGWPMAAMALALDVRLAKPGVYALNAAGGSAAEPCTAQAVAYADKAVLLFACLVAGLALTGAVLGVTQ